MTDMNDPSSEQAAKAMETQAESEDTTAEARLAELEAQLAEMKDRALREMADAENTRRRAQKEREETAKYAIAKFAKEILVVSDNFRRALDAAPKAESIADPVIKNLIVGIDATERQFLTTLESFGIKRLEALGKPFDPHFHRVMMEVETTDQPPGTVVQVLQAGYVIHDRLLREALVAVAKKTEDTLEHVDTTA